MRFVRSIHWGGVEPLVVGMRGTNVEGGSTPVLKYLHHHGSCLMAARDIDLQFVHQEVDNRAHERHASDDCRRLP